MSFLKKNMASLASMKNIYEIYHENVNALRKK